LEVLLTSPKGTVSRLAEKHSDAGKNYSNWTFMTVRNWGETAQGVWTLTVRDRVKSTTGTLKAATLTVFGSNASGGGGGSPTPGTTKTFTSADVPKAIPDNNAAGVTSTLPVAFTGNVTAAVLNLNITHTYKGDLKVSLISPGGTEAVVHANAGGSTDNVVLTGFSVPAMAGQATSGTWKIKAVDNAAQDTGSIQSWSLTLTN
jgi:subtilisin-like proprotein convertase family protein